MTKYPAKVVDACCWVLLGLAFLYTVLRASLLPVLHDEAVTYLYHARGTLWGIITNSYAFRPNNHILNTLLVKAFTSVFGTSELVLRIPALMGHALYLTAVYRCLKLFLKGPLLICGVSLMVFNPFLLELFSSARGYALGLGCAAYGIYLTFRHLRQRRLAGPGSVGGGASEITVIFWVFALAVLASFPFFHIFCGAFVSLFFAYRKDVKRFLGAVYRPLLFLTVLSCMSLSTLLKHRESLGGVTGAGLWEGTVRGLARATIYRSDVPPQPAEAVLMWGATGTAVAALAIFWLSRRRGVWREPPYVYLGHTMVWGLVSLAMIEIEGRILGIGFLDGRGGVSLVLLFYVLAVLLAGSAADVRGGPKTWRWVLLGIFAAVSVLSLWHFTRSARLTSGYVARGVESTRTAVKALAKLGQGRGLEDRSVSIASNWVFTPMLNYYILTEHVRWLKLLDYAPDLRERYDYYYVCYPGSPFAAGVPPGEFLAMGQKKLQVIRSFEKDGTYLAVEK